MKRSATKAEKQHMQRVANLGCIVCSECLGCMGSPAQVHHVRVRHGWGRSSHYETIPLCEPHHTGKDGVHSMGRDEFSNMYEKSEIELLDIVNGILGI